MSELRWHPLLQQWVVLSTHRQHRPQLDTQAAGDHCPFCPGSGKVPEGGYEVLLVPNEWASFAMEFAGAKGICEVVLYDSRHNVLPSELPRERWRQIIDQWRRRTEELYSISEIAYVAIFENQGPEVGVTISHPHGQIYGMPFVPPLVAQEVEASRGPQGCILCAEVAAEAGGVRVVFEDKDWVGWVPAWSRFPFELYLSLRWHVEHLAQLTEEESTALSAALSNIRRRYDALFNGPMPLMMHLRQAPRGERLHLHFQFHPIRRSQSKLKFLAGVESGLGFFLNDVDPDDAARRLRQAVDTDGSC